MPSGHHLVRRLLHVVSAGAFAVPVLLTAAPQSQQATPPPAGGQATSTPTLQQPVFKSSVDLVGVDVEVVDKDGKPVTDLAPGSFQVTINGHPRSVVSADFLKYATGPRDLTAAEPTVMYKPGGDDNAPAPPKGRIFILAIDDTSFDMGDMKPAIRAAQRFVQNLQPEDLVGVFTYPVGLETLDITHDHMLVQHALETVQGLKIPLTQLSAYQMSVSDVIAITSGDGNAYNGVVARICSPGDPGWQACALGVRGDASQLGGYLESEAAASLGKLDRLFASLADVPYRKTVVLVSGGLASANGPSGHPDVSGETKTIGRLAAAAGVNLYAVYIDSTAFAGVSASATPPIRSTAFGTYNRLGQQVEVPGFPAWDSRYADPVVSSSNDRPAYERGLDELADSAGGTVFPVYAGTSDRAFNRVLAETTSYYLLGVQPEDIDRDGQLHFISVKVRGDTVRSRTAVIIPKKSQ